MGFGEAPDDSDEIFYPPVFVAVSGAVEHGPLQDVGRSIVLINLNQVTRIEVVPPKPIRYEFPEVSSIKPRPETTEFRSDLHFPDGHIHRLTGSEAEAFSNWLLRLGIKRFDVFSEKPPV